MADTAPTYAPAQTNGWRAAVTDATVPDALGLAACVALSMGVLHPFMLNSRTALLSMPVSSACTLAVVCIVVLVDPLRHLARARALPAVLLCVASACAVAFACVYDPATRAVLFCVEQSCAVGALCCSALRLLHERSLLPLGCGVALAGIAGIAAYGLGGLFGVTGNTANLTTVMLIGYGAFGLVGVLFIAFGKRNHPDEAQTEQTDGLGARVRTTSSRAAQIAMFAAICVSGIAAAFFDGITFNPYVHDVPGIDLVADVIALVGGCAFALCSVRSRERLATSIYGCITACLVLSILGVALVSVSMQGVGLPIGCIGASRVLMFASVLAFLLIVGQAKPLFVFVAFGVRHLGQPARRLQHRHHHAHRVGGRRVPVDRVARAERPFGAAHQHHPKHLRAGTDHPAGGVLERADRGEARGKPADATCPEGPSQRTGSRSPRDAQPPTD